MEIPLKSQPKVSTVNLVDELKFLPVPNVSLIRAPAESPNLFSKNYKLTRTYSESETNNFDEETGHRLYDDGRIRSKHRTEGLLYTRSHTYIDNDPTLLVGLEDEYIPGLDFSDMVHQWGSDHNLNRYESGQPIFNFKTETNLTASTTSNTPSSRTALYLDLNTLHAKVEPQPIQLRHPQKYSLTKLLDYMKLRKEEQHKKQKLDSLEVNYEAILNSLPPNFNDLPYSQRKRLVKSFSELIDYLQFSLFAKNFERGSGRTPRSGLFSRRLRVSSANTVANRLLAMSSSVDLKQQKVNVDEKGALVLGHHLGKVIGFGAWGTIRECFGDDGSVKAMKIVKLVREELPTRSRKHNPRVLEVMKQEIDIWKQLRHENILPLFDHLETPDTVFCLTNRISGGTLFEVVTKWGVFDSGVGALGKVEFSFDTQVHRLRHVTNYTGQIVDALVYLHQELGIVHGDLKLENVLVEDTDKHHVKMVLCDFGMSRVYTRLSRRLSRRNDLRSKSSAADVRKPYSGESARTKFLFTDDLKIGISHYAKNHGPLLQTMNLTPTQSSENVSISTLLHESREPLDSSIELNLPHSHIGSLPYALPELLLPTPPPLGPSADIWALGVLLYAMIVGKLPFQHPYEPRLRATISAGQYNQLDLCRACLTAWILDHDTPRRLATFVSPEELEVRDEAIAQLRKTWDGYEQLQFVWLQNLVVGCLEADITQRWDLPAIHDTVISKM